jgi:CdiI N-terminal domain
MFRVRFFTRPVQNEAGLFQAGGELCLGSQRIGFVVDLSHWSVAEYESQWKEGTARLLHGAPKSALMTGYRGPGEATHLIWALWREGGYVYAQEHPVVVTELDPPFDPSDPYAHVGERIATSGLNLPISEWQVDLIHVYAHALGLRWPLAS